MADRDENATEVKRAERQFMRLADRLRIELRQAGDDEREGLADRIGTAPTLSGADPEEVLSRLADGNAASADLGRILLARLDRIEEQLAALSRRLGEQEHASGSGWVTGETLDLSGSGVAAAVPLACSTGDILDVKLRLPGDGGSIRALARVVSVGDPDGDEVPVGRYRLGLGFVAINETDRESLIRAIFRRQRAMLRDGQLRLP